MLRLSALAREELRHFEQVVAILAKRDIEYRQLSSARYAGELRKLVRTHEPARLIDLMVVSGVVEARSCERFERLMTVLDEELATFYSSLWRSEARHCGDYLSFARKRDPDGFAIRLKEVIECDESADYFKGSIVQISLRYSCLALANKTSSPQGVNIGFDS